MTRFPRHISSLILLIVHEVRFCYISALHLPSSYSYFTIPANGSIWLNGITADAKLSVVDLICQNQTEGPNLIVHFNANVDQC